MCLIPDAQPMLATPVAPHAQADSRRAICTTFPHFPPGSTGLGYTATNEVLSTNSYRRIDEAAYKLGCRYTTPDRFNFHIEQPPGSAEGHRLGDIFDATYVQRVSERTAGLYDGIEKLLRSLALSGHPQVGYIHM
jgi:hypothetical protein